MRKVKRTYQILNPKPFFSFFQAGIKGDMRTYNMMMKSLTIIKEWDQAMSVMSEMRAQGLQPDADSISSLFDV